MQRYDKTYPAGKGHTKGSSGEDGRMKTELPMVRYRRSPLSARGACNTIINFVPQQEAWIVERMGKFHKVLDAGVHFLIPFIDNIRYVQSLKEIAVDVCPQGAITLDNVQLSLDGVVYVRVTDPYKASYGVADVEFAVTQMAQTTMRSEIGKINLDAAFREREQLNHAVVDAINIAAEPWGIVCLRYEIRDMNMPSRIQEAMQMQMEAERKKRAVILESEGSREAAINKAEGAKRARILASEAHMQEKINEANGVARAMELQAESRQKGLDMVAAALSTPGGQNAASLTLAEQYMTAFGHLAQTSNTVIMPANVADANAMVTQALSVYNALSNGNAMKGNGR